MKKLVIAAVVPIIALSCFPVDGCACLPNVSRHILYGDAPGAGTPDAWQRMRVELGGPSVCDAFAGFHSETHVVPASGTFRQEVVGLPNAQHCVRVAFFKTPEVGSDSIVLNPMLVDFASSSGSPDSTLIVLPP